jgi:hypothetical protein
VKDKQQIWRWEFTSPELSLLNNSGAFLRPAKQKAARKVPGRENG